MFYADAWSLALHNKELFPEKFQAWVHGPVLVSQYHRFKEFKWRPITDEIKAAEVSLELREHLNEIVDVYGSETAVSLELMTHREKPWLEARGDISSSEPSSAQISKAITRAFYGDMH